MPSAPNTPIDYKAASTWHRLASLLSRVEPHPSRHCGRVHCEPGWNWQPRLIDHDLWLAVEGSGQFVLQGQTYSIQPGTLFWLRPGDEGTATQDLNDRLTVVYLHFTFCQPGTDEVVSFDRHDLPSPSIQLSDPARVDMLLTRTVRLMHLARPFGELEARLLLHQAILEIYRQDAAQHQAIEPGPDARIAQVIAHLHAHSSARLPLAEAAAMAGLSPDYFSQLFKTETGMTFRRYALEVRLERARHLLEETTMSVSEIARALGYDEVFLFSRQFKARYGLAPTLLRRPATGAGA